VVVSVSAYAFGRSWTVSRVCILLLIKAGGTTAEILLTEAKKGRRGAYANSGHCYRGHQSSMVRVVKKSCLDNWKL
jgi:hypothetical protein